jgi:hypothetical protein
LRLDKRAVPPDTGDILLGALPLEGMDLMVDPVNQRLTGVLSNYQIPATRPLLVCPAGSRAWQAGNYP